VDKENNNGVSPLMAAARDGFTAIVKVLLAAGADFEQVDGEWTSVCCISCVRKLDPASPMERAQCAPQDCTESSVSCGWQQVCNGSRAALTSMGGGAPPPPPSTHRVRPYRRFSGPGEGLRRDLSGGLGVGQGAPQVMITGGMQASRVCWAGRYTTRNGIKFTL
jgi:hypothetical protein